MADAAFDIQTSHARISVLDNQVDGPALLLIHGNSACKEIFAAQFAAPFARRYRLIAFDLPGHGASADAIEPERTYQIPGYADVALELLAKLAIDRLAILGWSLGGHIGIELLTRPTDIVGLVITGTPPVGHNPDDFAAGFRPHPHMQLTGKRDFTATDIVDYAHDTAGVPAPFIEAAVRRCDGRARELMMAAALGGRGADQRRVASTSNVPIAVITGADEPFVDNGYLERFPYRNLWERRVHVIGGSGHAPFYEQPADYNALLERFLDASYG
jgi:pimeloyl-ACP methyl ester carboxylesterase